MADELQVPSLTPEPMPLPTPVEPEPIVQADPNAAENDPYALPNPIESSLVFNAYAINALDALSYDEGIAQLKSAYTKNVWDDPDAALKVMDEYSSKLQDKFKVTPTDFDVLKNAPIAPSLITSDKTDETDRTYDLINKFEDKNIEFLETTKDPDYLAVKRPLMAAIRRYSRELRKEVATDSDTGGITSFIGDVARAGTAAMIDPFSEIITGQPTRISDKISAKNEGITTDVAGFVGGAAPMIAATVAAGPLGVVAGSAVGLAQAAGATRNIYEETLAQTGSEDKATNAGTIMGVVQGTATIPIAGIVSSQAKIGLGKALLQDLEKDLGKETLKHVGSAAAITAAQRLGGNLAVKQGLNPEQDLSEGVLKDAAIGGVIFGGLGSAAAAVRKGRAHAVLKEASNMMAEAEGVKTESPVSKTPETSLSLVSSEADVLKGFDKIEADAEARKVTQTEPIPVDSPDRAVLNESLPPEPSEANLQARKDIYEGIADTFERDIPETKYNPDEQSLAVKPVKEFLGDKVNDKNVILATDPETVEAKFEKLKNTTPFRLMMNLLSNTGGSLRTRLSTLGRNGFYQLRDKVVNIPRSAGANWNAVIKTIAHEIGHHIQRIGAASPKDMLEQPLFDAYYRAYKGLERILDNEPQLKDQATRASKEWRPGWTEEASSDYKKYRSEPAEVYADTASYLFLDPEGLKQKYPKLYRAIDLGLQSDAQTANHWKELQAFWNDKTRLQDYMYNERAKERAETPNILKAAAEQKINDRPGFTTTAKRVGEWLKKGLFMRDADVKDIVARTADPKSKAKLEEYANYIGAAAAVRNNLLAAQEKAEKSVIRELKYYNLTTEDGRADINALGEYLELNNLEKGETAVMAAIKEDLPSISVVAAELVKLLKTAAGDETIGSKKYILKLTEALASQDPERVTDALAQLKHDLDTRPAQLSPKQEKELAKIANPEERNKARNAMLQVKENLSVNRESPYRKALNKAISEIKDSNLREALKILTSPRSFNVRKYLLNPMGLSRFDIAEKREVLTRKVGGEAQYKNLEKVADTYYNGLRPLYDTITESGVLPPELVDRINRNSRSYANVNINEYFEADPNFSGIIKEAVGTLMSAGDEVISTYKKVAAVTGYVLEQKRTNALVSIATSADSGFPIEKVKVPYGDNIYEKRDALRTKDPKNSYLITRVDGKTDLYKLPGKYWEHVLHDPQMGAVMGAVSRFVDITRNLAFTRETKTILNLAFALSLRARAIKKESLARDIKRPSLIFAHSDAEGRRLSAKASQEISHYLNNNGEFIPGGNLKDAYDHGAFNSYLAFQGENDSVINPGDGFIAAHGVTLPDVRTWDRKFNQAVMKGIKKVPLVNRVYSFQEGMVRKEQMRSKYMGYLIGKEMGMNDHAAAQYAREIFGDPNPESGGFYGGAAAKLFLFGRDFLNDLTSSARILKSLGVKNGSMQLGLRVVLPRLLMNPIVMGSALTGLLGKEAGDQYKKWLAYIPAREKLYKQIIPIGWMSPNNDFHSLFSVPNSKITEDWKAMYLRLPQAKEVTDTAMLLGPLIDGMIEGTFSDAVSETPHNVMQTFLGANWDPSLSLVYNMGAMAAWGRTPEDSFRNKPLLSKKEMAIGGVQAYAKTLSRSLLKQYANQIPNDLFRDDAHVNVQPSVMSAPLAGPVMRSFLGIQNYGISEAQDRAENKASRQDAILESDMSKDTRKVLNLYRGLQTKVSQKGGLDNLNPEERNKYYILRTWREQTYKNYFNEMKNSASKDDTESIDYFNDLLDKTARPVLAAVEPPSK